MRTGRTNGTNTYEYMYNGAQLMQMTRNGVVMNFTYINGIPATISYGGNTFYYVVNGQGDVTGITDSNGVIQVTYYYDAWGATSSVYNPDSAHGLTLATINPLRYRGYVFDWEVGLYYLQSRYYIPEIGRFLNADGLVSTGQGILGNSMFAYCNNSPVNMIDRTGTRPYQLFDSVEEAALDFANYYNQQSIEDGQEYGAAIFRYTFIERRKRRVRKTYRFFFSTLTVEYNETYYVKTYKYYYNWPAIGNDGESVLPNLLGIGNIVSTVHTHANYDPTYGAGNDDFSTGLWSDLFYANMFRMDIFVATPGGYLKKYTYDDRKNSDNGITIISDEIPWDPNHPDR